MNYNKLKDLLIAKNIAIAKAAQHIGRSQNWFHSAVKNDTMTISDLEKILKLCKSSTAEFFAGETTIVSDLEVKYGDKEEMLKVYRDLVNSLKSENKLLKEKCGENEAMPNKQSTLMK